MCEEGIFLLRREWNRHRSFFTTGPYDKVFVRDIAGLSKRLAYGELVVVKPTLSTGFQAGETSVSIGTGRAYLVDAHR